MKKINDLVPLILLFFYTVIGIYLSVKTGLSFDEFHEQHNWEVNSEAIKSFFNNQYQYERLLNYKEKYYGIAFHLISQPIQFFISDFITKFNEMNIDEGYLISRHPVIFLCFSLSGFFFYKLSKKISGNEFFAIFSTSVYLLYPYLFGHAQINPKDIPFMSIWLVCTFCSLRLVENLLFKKNILIRDIIIISFLSAFLISMRTLGVVIFIQYLISLIIYLNITNESPINFIKQNIKNLILFLLLFLFFLYTLNPIYWKNPFEFINSIKWYGKFYHDICTLTFGTCVRSLELPASYYAIWFFFKIPIFIIFGFLIFPFVEKIIFQDKIKSLYYGTFILSILTILVIFIIRKVSLYDEIRHLIFLFPLIFLVSLLNIFIFNKRLFYYMSSFLIIFFTLENISLNPYQYTWLNSFAKTVDIKKNFEVDYFGISNKNLQKKIIEIVNKKKIDKRTCIYGNIYIKAYLLPQNFTCLKSYSEMDEAKERPFFAYQNVRNMKRSKPNDCDLVWREKYKYTFYNTEIVAGNLWYCG